MISIIIEIVNRMKPTYINGIAYSTVNKAHIILMRNTKT